MKAHHGTAENFTSFDSDARGSATGGAGTDQCWWFSADRDAAEYWGREAIINSGGDEGYILTCELDMQDPLTVDMDDYRDDPYAIQTIIDLAMDQDCDGIICHNMVDTEDGQAETVIAIFDDSQIEIVGRERLEK